MIYHVVSFKSQITVATGVSRVPAGSMDRHWREVLLMIALPGPPDNGAGAVPPSPALQPAGPLLIPRCHQAPG